MAHTVADQMVETLAAAGVKRIYGIVGDSLNGFTDSLRRHGGGIQWLHVRHEEVAAFAAGADAHVTGELAVCAGSCGPGNLHLINGLFDCHRSRVPVVAIAAHIPSPEIGSGFFQETHPEHLFRECTTIANSSPAPSRCRARWRSRCGGDRRALRQRHRDSRATSRSSRRRTRSSRFPWARAGGAHRFAARRRARPVGGSLNKAERVTLLCGSGLRRIA